MRHQLKVLAILLALPLFAAGPFPALADEVHLKNGRTMLAERTEVDGDRLVLYQNGNRLEIPMAIVDRVVETALAPAETAPGATSVPAPEPPRAEAAAAEPAVATAAEPEDPESAEDAEIPPEQTEEYWQERVAAISAEKAELDAAIVELRSEERAFLFSHRSTADTKTKIDAAEARQKQLDDEMAELRREARRLNIPPGWLRVR